MGGPAVVRDPDRADLGRPDLDPDLVTLHSYQTLFSASPFALNILNSVLVTVSVVVGAAIVSVLAAYVFARIEFRGREVLFTLFLAALTLPSQVSAVPSFVVVKYLHLLNTQAALIIPALIQVVAVFLLRQHFRTIPTDLDDAARIDGAGHLTIIRRIMVPLSWPAISAVMVITGQYIWNDFFWPNLYINSTSRMTAPLALYNLESVAGRRPDRGRVRRPVGAVRPVRDRVRVPAAPPDGGHRLPRHLAGETELL